MIGPGHWTLDIGHWVKVLYIYILLWYLKKFDFLTIKFLGISEGQIWRHSVNIFDWTWTMDIGAWTLIGYWALDIGQWTLEIGYWTL